MIQNRLYLVSFVFFVQYFKLCFKKQYFFLKSLVNLQYLNCKNKYSSPFYICLVSSHFRMLIRFFIKIIKFVINVRYFVDRNFSVILCLLHYQYFPKYLGGTPMYFFQYFSNRMTVLQYFNTHYIESS